jgi:hypothetical protein
MSILAASVTTQVVLYGQKLCSVIYQLFYKTEPLFLSDLQRIAGR